jgi:hypothetical protein
MLTVTIDSGSSSHTVVPVYKTSWLNDIETGLVLRLFVGKIRNAMSGRSLYKDKLLYFSGSGALDTENF